MDDAEAIESRSEPLTDALTGTLVLAGKPMTMARVRFKRNGPAYTPADRVNRQGDFAQAWVDARQPRFPKGIALAAEFEFVFARPESHYGTGRNAGKLKPLAPKRPGRGVNGGDLDNLVKLVTDALSEVAYHDDSQIAECSERKRYVEGDEFPHTRVTIRAI